MLPSRTKYGWRLRLIVSTTSGSAAWTRSRTCWQTSRCQAGSASRYASTRGSVAYDIRLAPPDARFGAYRRAPLHPGRRCCSIRSTVVRPRNRPLSQGLEWDLLPVPSTSRKTAMGAGGVQSPPYRAGGVVGDRDRPRAGVRGSVRRRRLHRRHAAARRAAGSGDGAPRHLAGVRRPDEIGRAVTPPRRRRPWTQRRRRPWTQRRRRPWTQRRRRPGTQRRRRRWTPCRRRPARRRPGATPRSHAVVAVITSLYPAVTIGLARTVLRERTMPTQNIGLVLCGVAVVAFAVS